MISLRQAERFHGHLGPWLVLGLIAGEYGLKKIKAKKYFGLKVTVSGLNIKPRSCLIDGLQLSTGCTLGKGNIFLNGNRKIKIVFKNRKNESKASLELKSAILKNLNEKMSHKEAQLIARSLYKTNPLEIFQIVK